MTDEERKELGDRFVKELNKIGIKDIKDIPASAQPTSFNSKEYKTVWVIK